MDNTIKEAEISQSISHPSLTSLSSSSSRPTSKMLDSSSQEKQDRKQDELVVGQLSYAPAVSTTVVTTTTTTTTTFPPIMMKAPKHLHNLDRRLYPLASSPTPASIKRFQFNIGEQSAIFQEAEDTDATLARLKKQEETLKAARGKIQTISTTTGSPITPRTTSHSRGRLDPIKQRTRPSQSSNPSNSSIADTRPRASRLQSSQISTPFTPSSTDTRPVLDSFNTSQESISSAIITPELEEAEFPQIPSPQEQEQDQSIENLARNSFYNANLEGGSTPSARDVLNRRISSSRARPSLLDLSVAQDVSLPSPSLSPVTAAANLRDRREYFSDLQSSALISKSSSHLSDSVSNDLAQNFSPFDRELSIQDIPLMLDAFEAMADEMKSYYMYQLLRRCPKMVLHMVGQTIEPALKRDFLAELPTELSQHILKFLDVRSLCRAAQVSRKWRTVVDTDEKTWKDKFDAAGFSLTFSELKQAIAEGWGWQADSSRHGREENVISPGSTETTAAIAADEQTSREAEPTSSKRTKRKATTQSGRGRKQRKRRPTSTSDNADFDTEALERHLSTVDGPFAAARVAEGIAPRDDVGLPGLQVMHLQKSLYRRHHQFGGSWINEVTPRHLAFRAHALNVITCLQFDSERIVTGSDDTNINVYDTQTGALKAKLEGHDGGVWALQYVGNQLVSGSTDRSVRIWDMEQGVCTHTFSGHTSTVRCLIILMPKEVGRTASGSPIMMPKEPLIITGSRDSTLRVWKLPRPDEPYYNTPTPDDEDCPYLIRTLVGHGHSVRAIAARGDTLVSGSYDSTVRVWRISTGAIVHRLVGHTAKVYSVVGDWEGGRVISGSMDNMVKIWSLETGNQLFNLEGHTSLVGLLDYQRDRLVSAAADGSLRIWSADLGVCVKNLIGHGAAITCFQHDATKIVSGSDRSLKLWDINTGEFVRDLLADLSGVWQVKFDERRCVAAVQRQGQTFIEVLDFGASRDGVPTEKRGRRILVDINGVELPEPRIDDDGEVTDEQ